MIPEFRVICQISAFFCKDLIGSIENVITHPSFCSHTFQVTLTRFSFCILWFSEWLKISRICFFTIRQSAQMSLTHHFWFSIFFLKNLDIFYSNTCCHAQSGFQSGPETKAFMEFLSPTQVYNNLSNNEHLNLCATTLQWFGFWNWNSKKFKYFSSFLTKMQTAWASESIENWMGNQIFHNFFR